MAKSIRRKTAKFELEPDGFSIHTFELSCQIKGKQYREIKEYLYSLNAAKGEIYDKTYQMAVEKLTEVSYEDYDAGVLRFECRLMRDPLRKVMEKYECKTTRELPKHLIAHSEEMMSNHEPRAMLG